MSCPKKTEELDLSLFSNKLCKKVNVTGSFLSRDRIPEPWLVTGEIKLSDGFNIWIEKGFEDQFAYVLFFILIMTEYFHVLTYSCS